MKIDKPTANLNRPSIARICVEMDLLKGIATIIWISTRDGKGFWQTILYEDLPLYYSHCKRIGHDSSKCKKLLLVKFLGKDGVDHIAVGKEHKKLDDPTSTGRNKRVTWAPIDKDISTAATVLHSVHLPQEFRLSHN